MRGHSLWVGLSLFVLASVVPLLPWVVQVVVSLIGVIAIVLTVVAWWQWWVAEASRRKSGENPHS